MQVYKLYTTYMLCSYRCFGRWSSCYKIIISWYLLILCSSSSDFPSVPAATGWTFRWKAPPCPEPSTAGTEASRTTTTTRATAPTTTKSTRPHPREVALYVWSTAARGLTATPHARLFEISWPDRRWASSSSWSTWALTCRRWHSNRGWTPGRYWACSITGTKMPFFFSKCSDVGRTWTRVKKLSTSKHPTTIRTTQTKLCRVWKRLLSRIQSNQNVWAV